MSAKTVLCRRGAFALAALLLAPPALSARQQCADKKKVRVSVVVILATERDGKVDPKLKCIAAEVKKIHPKLTGFHMKTIGCQSVTVDEAGEFQLVDDQVARITVQRAADARGRVQLKVVPPQMGEITYSTPCGKFLPIVTRYRTRKGDLLIIAVRVQPCPGKKK
jgi:hypothetical protein